MKISSGIKFFPLLVLRIFSGTKFFPYRFRDFFPVPIFSDTGSETIFPYQIAPVPVPIPTKFPVPVCHTLLPTDSSPFTTLQSGNCTCVWKSLYLYLYLLLIITQVSCPSPTDSCQLTAQQASRRSSSHLVWLPSMPRMSFCLLSFVHWFLKKKLHLVWLPRHRRCLEISPAFVFCSLIPTTKNCTLCWCPVFPLLSFAQTGLCLYL